MKRAHCDLHSSQFFLFVKSGVDLSQLRGRRFCFRSKWTPSGTSVSLHARLPLIESFVELLAIEGNFWQRSELSARDPIDDAQCHGLGEALRVILLKARHELVDVAASCDVIELLTQILLQFREPVDFLPRDGV